jgi:integrase
LKGDLEHGQRALSKKTIRNVLTLLGEILARAVSEGYLRHSPMEAVEKPKASREKKGRALKPDDVQGILKHCAGNLRLPFLTALLTGLRRGELFGLWWEDIDLDHNVVRVRRSLYWAHGKNHKKAEGDPSWLYVTPKSKNSLREVDLSPALRKELLAHRLASGRASGLVFCSAAGTPLTPENVTKRALTKALEKLDAERAKEKQASIGKVRWHDLRHTFGSMKLEQGENVYYVQRQMGSQLDPGHRRHLRSPARDAEAGGGGEDRYAHFWTIGLLLWLFTCAAQVVRHVEFEISDGFIGEAKTSEISESCAG